MKYFLPWFILGLTPMLADAPATALPRFVEYGEGTGCLPCKMMVQVLEELRNDESQHFVVEVVDLRKERNLIHELHLRVLPTQILYDNQGHELARHEGFYSKDDILAKWKSLGYSVAPK